MSGRGRDSGSGSGRGAHPRVGSLKGDQGHDSGNGRSSRLSDSANSVLRSSFTALEKLYNSHDWVEGIVVSAPHHTACERALSTHPQHITKTCSGNCYSKTRKFICVGRTRKHAIMVPVYMNRGTTPDTSLADNYVGVREEACKLTAKLEDNIHPTIWVQPHPKHKVPDESWFKMIDETRIELTALHVHYLAVPCTIIAQVLLASLEQLKTLVRRFCLGLDNVTKEEWKEMQKNAPNNASAQAQNNSQD